MARFILLFCIVVLISGCGEKTFKHYDYEYSERSYSWGTLAIWAIGTPTQQNEKTTLIGAPYRLIVQFKMHDAVPKCTVLLNSVQLNQTDSHNIIPLSTRKESEFKKDTSRSQADLFFDHRDWYATYFPFDKMQLEYLDYELNMSFDFNGDCGKAAGESATFLLKRKHYETTDAIWYQ